MRFTANAPLSTLGVTRSGFYEWQRQPLCDRALADWLLTEQIRDIFDESEQTYGSPRVYRRGVW